MRAATRADATALWALEMGAAHALPAMHTLAMHTLHTSATAPTAFEPPLDATRDAASAAARSALRTAATRADATALWALEALKVGFRS